MTSYRPFGPLDLFAFNAVNLDKYTETVKYILILMHGNSIIFPFTVIILSIGPNIIE